MRVFKPDEKPDEASIAAGIIIVGDDLGAGGAFTKYSLGTPNNVVEFEFLPKPGGLTNESLLSVVRDRLEGFQSGPYACEENARALERVRDAIEYLENRAKRIAAQNAESNSSPG